MHKTRVHTDNFVHQQILQGSAYQIITDAAPVTSDTPLQLLIQTGELEVIITLASVIASGDNVVGTGYSGAEVSALGTLAIVRNKNDVVNGIPVTKCYLNPTVTSLGEEMAAKASFGSNQMPERDFDLADISKGDFYVLKPNYNYLLQIVSEGASTVYFTLAFTESNYMD